jgi:hypothetical protein
MRSTLKYRELDVKNNFEWMGAVGAREGSSSGWTGENEMVSRDGSGLLSGRAG